MQKNTLKLTLVLLLFGILFPIEILGQYASPYLNPIGSQENPAAIVWRDKSIVGVATNTRIDEKNSPMTQRDTNISNSFMLANMGDFFGFKSGFEFMVGEGKSTSEFVDSDTTEGYTVQSFDKTGGFAIGPLAIGYTDANAFKAKMLGIQKTTDDLQEFTMTVTQKLNRKGLSLKLSNFFVGISQSSNEHKDLSADMKITNLSDSSVTNFSAIDSDYIENENTVGIGILIGKENENRYRLEIFNTHKPKVQYSQILTNLSDGSVSTSIKTSNEEKTNGVVLETQINNYYYTLMYIKSVTSNAGTSSGKAYSNKTGQEIMGWISVPLGESFQFNIELKQGLKTQPYTASPDEYKRYEVKKSYSFALAYLY